VEWFSALNVPRDNKNIGKNQHKCLPITKKETNDKEGSIKLKWDLQGINSSKGRGRWPKPPCMTVLALDRKDISWVHNQYSSLKLTYHKMILRE
jgi:hypothetical protein